MHAASPKWGICSQKVMLLPRSLDVRWKRAAEAAKAGQGYDALGALGGIQRTQSATVRICRSFARESGTSLVTVRHSYSMALILTGSLQRVQAAQAI